MIHQIYTEEECESIEEEYKDRAFYIVLPDDVIQEWIQNKYFAHLKKELQVFHNVYFACKKGAGGCMYSFFFESEAARNRFGNMIANIFYSGELVRMVNCSPDSDGDEEVSTGALSMAACPLF